MHYMTGAMSSQAAAVMRRFKLHTLLSVAFMFLVHLSCFAAIVVLVIGLEDNVTDLNASGAGQAWFQDGSGLEPSHHVS